MNQAKFQLYWLFYQHPLNHAPFEGNRLYLVGRLLVLFHHKSATNYLRKCTGVINRYPTEQFTEVQVVSTTPVISKFTLTCLAAVP